MRPKFWVVWLAEVLITGNLPRPKKAINELEIRMVEGVEHFHAELKSVMFPHYPVLCHRDIKVLAAWRSYATANQTPRSL